jgi:hypothetical protein
MKHYLAAVVAAVGFVFVMGTAEASIIQPYYDSFSCIQIPAHSYPLGQTFTLSEEEIIYSIGFKVTEEWSGEVPPESPNEPVTVELFDPGMSSLGTSTAQIPLGLNGWFDWDFGGLVAPLDGTYTALLYASNKRWVICWGHRNPYAGGYFTAAGELYPGLDMAFRVITDSEDLTHPDQNVPDGGTTLFLLGGALTGLAALKCRRVA